jgi:pyruvate/2-oxoglutarate dehydrogenase complex dihydrolipoamide dehydrogenase (E3) component
VTLATSGGTWSLEGSDILVATGRIPNTENIGLDQTGVALDARRYVQVNERVETTAPGIWAFGRVRRQPSIHAYL